MNINKIKQAMDLQREIRKENDSIINIDDERVLVRDKLFKQIFQDKEYSVKLDSGTYYYNGEFEGIKFTANNDKPIFEYIIHG